eukprot:NODE_44_length_33449_cov_1.575742.p9 type:complete len:342 gc:universal NODE_44_length_33449_cov_1.575742:15804-16829(+)
MFLLNTLFNGLSISPSDAKAAVTKFASTPQVQQLVKMVESSPASTPSAQSAAPSAQVPTLSPPSLTAPPLPPAKVEDSTPSPAESPQTASAPSEPTTKAVDPTGTTQPATKNSSNYSNKQDGSGENYSTTTIVLPVCGAVVFLIGGAYFIKRRNKKKQSSAIFNSERSLSDDDSSSGHHSIFSDQRHMAETSQYNDQRNTVQTVSTLDSRGRSTEYSDYQNTNYKSGFSSQYVSDSDYNGGTAYSEFSEQMQLPEVERMSHLSVSNILTSDGDADTVAGTQYNSQFQSYYTSDSRVSGISEYSEYSELSVYTEDTSSSYQPSQNYSVYSESEIENDSINYQ